MLVSLCPVINDLYLPEYKLQYVYVAGFKLPQSVDLGQLRFPVLQSTKLQARSVNSVAHVWPIRNMFYFIIHLVHAYQHVIKSSEI